MFYTSGGGVNSCYNCNSDTLLQGTIIEECLSPRETITYLSDGEMSRSDREGLTCSGVRERSGCKYTLPLSKGEDRMLNELERIESILGEGSSHRANSIPSPIGGRCAELGWGLVRRKIISNNTLPFKQFFSSPNLVFKLCESLVIEMHFPAQGFRKELLETISHNKIQVVTASVSEAVQFFNFLTGLLRRIAPRNDRGKYFIPSPRGRAREGVKLC